MVGLPLRFRVLRLGTIGTLLWPVLALVPEPATAQGQPGVVTGRVVDETTGGPVGGVEVWLDEGRARVSTRDDGSFTIRSVAPGSYILRASRIGYDDVVVVGVVVGAAGAVVEVSMMPGAIPLAELVVTPGAFAFMGSTPSTRQTMSRVDIESVPQFAEDIFRAVNRLPGLASGDYSAHFSVRGGRHDETLILLDGLEIYEPYHLKDFNDGAISIIDVETIGGADLMTGGFPVRYGNRTSAVFSVSSRDPEAEKTRYSLGMSLVNARAMVEGSFGGGRGSWFASGRRGYLDLVLSLLNQNEVPSPSYYDLFGKLKLDLTPSQSVALNVLRAGDTYTFNALATTGYQDTIPTEERADNRYGNSYVWATHEALIGDRASARTIVSAGLVTAARAGTEFYRSNDQPIYDLTNTRDFSVLGLKHDLRLDWAPWASLEVGFDLRRLDADYAILNVVNQDPDSAVPDTTGFYPHEQRSSASRHGTTLGVYASNRFRLGGRVTVELGGRYDRGSYTGDRDFSPRAGALLALTDATNLRVGWGEFRQMQGIGDLALLDGEDRYFGSESSDQWTAGLEHVFDAGGLLRIEAYRKIGSDLRPVHRNWKGGLDVFPETNEDRILVRPSRIESKGVEIYHQRNLNDRISLRGSYALAVVDETTTAIENVNDPFPLLYSEIHGGPQDQRHALNVDATYRVSESWSLNGSLAFHTGWPGTLEELRQVRDESGELESVIRPTEIYGHRLPNYARFDVRLTKRSPFRGGDLRFFFEVSNLTNHENVFGYDYFRSPGPSGIGLQRDVETGFTILPSLGVSWTH